MIKSMTGFGNASYDDEIYHLAIEIKAVNNRYCDIQLKLPANLHFLEEDLYKEIKSYKFRGKIEVFVKFRHTPAVNNSLSVDKSLLIAYYNTLKYMSQTVAEIDPDNDLPPITMADLLNYPDLVTINEDQLNKGEIKAITLATLTRALAQFNQAKEQEGAVLAQDITQRIDLIKNHLAAIKTLAPERLIKYRAHLNNLLADLLKDWEGEAKEQRILQETALMADKLDITEELTRFASHLQQFFTISKMATGVGRSLDFLLQEMNREANTIGSKANHSEIAHLVVAIKGELEKIREQIQNIE